MPARPRDVLDVVGNIKSYIGDKTGAAGDCFPRHRGQARALVEKADLVVLPVVTAAARQ